MSPTSPINFSSPIDVASDESGNALVEFAVFLSLLAFIVVGMVDYSFAIHEAMQVQQAAAAGASFGAIPGNESNLGAIQTATQNAATGIPGFSVSVTNLWACSAAGASVTSTTVCGPGVTPFKYVVVKTSGSVPKPLSFPGISSNGTVYGSAVFQVPWSR